MNNLVRQISININININFNLIDLAIDQIEGSMITALKEITDPVVMMTYLYENPRILNHLDILQEVLNDIDPIGHLPLQNYLQTLLWRLRNGDNLTVEEKQAIVITSDSEQTQRKRNRPVPVRKLDCMNKSDLIHVLRSRPPKNEHNEPYTVAEIRSMSRHNMILYIRKTFPREFA